MVAILRNECKRSKHENPEEDRRSESDDYQHLINNPCLYMFYTPSRLGDNDEEINMNMPDCDDFLVFHIKKSKFLKVIRLFQCHC